MNLSRFDLVSLRLFAAVVEGGSLTAGAERFGISLAAASKRIAELESHVGTPLLVRSKRGAATTAAGDTLLRHVIEVVADLEQMAVSMEDFQRGSGGHLRLWANVSAFSGMLPSVLAEYTRTHPTVTVDLEDAISEDTVRAVARGVAELGIIGDVTAHDGLDAIVCDVDELVLLLPVGHAWASAASVDIAQALTMDLVGMNRATSLMRQLSALADAHGTPLKLRVQVRSFDAMCRMVAAGLGIAVLPLSGARMHLHAMGLVTRTLSGMRTQRRLILVMRDRHTLTPVARDFVALVESRAASLTPTHASNTRASPRAA